MNGVAFCWLEGNVAESSEGLMPRISRRFDYTGVTNAMFLGLRRRGVECVVAFLERSESHHLETLILLWKDM